jgi:hypothetical protein
MRSAALVVGVAVLLAPFGLVGQTTAQGFEGAWRVTEVVTTGPGARTMRSPQPGMLLFTGRYYSYTLVTGDQPRPDQPRGLPTAEALVMLWNPFSANAGTFEVSGNTMTRRPIVSKSPDAMAPGAFNAYTFRMSADTLWLTTARTEGGPARNPTTVRYVRVR